MEDRIKSFARRSEPYVCLTAYTTPMAAIMAPYVDLILVGDSVAMTIYGAENTLEADLDMMIRHGRAVRRGAPDSLIVVDMPAGTYDDPQAALINAKRLITATGGDAVKLEGGQSVAETIAHLTHHGVPVMGHIGLLPQNVLTEGGYKIKGKTEDDIARLVVDAQTIEQAEAFSLVIEGTIHNAADAITRAISIPTIGIGASCACDGQILVCDDMLGLTPGRVARFVKDYAHLDETMARAIQDYAQDVRARRFPADTHLYKKA